MKIERTFLLMVLSVTLAACGGGDEAEVAEGDGAAMDTTAMTPAPMPMPADSGAMASGGMAGAQTVALQGVGGAPVTGSVAVSEAGGGTQVVLTVAGAGGAGTHAAHVHTGTCDAPGDVVAPLESVTADATGAGTSTTTLQIPMATVMNGQHIVAVHEAGGSPGAPVACAAIPQHSM